MLCCTQYNALSMWKKTPKTAPSSWDFVTLSEDLAAAIGNMHKKFGKHHACGSGDTDILADRQTDRQTDRLIDRQAQSHTDVLIIILRHRSRRRSNYCFLTFKIIVLMASHSGLKCSHTFYGRPA